MSLPKFNKLYFPGLISLVFLPLMCICYFEKHSVFQKYYAMNIVVANKESLDEWSKISKTDHHVELFRKYHEFILTGNSMTDKKTTNRIEGLIRQLIVKNDTTNGISVAFGSHAQYAEFISVLDMCYQSFNHNLGFVPFEGKILIWHLPAFRSGLFFDRINVDNSHVFIDNILPQKAGKVPSVAEKLMIDLHKIEKTAMEFWPSLLAFIMMIGFAIFKSRRYLTLRSPHLAHN